jgi:DNA-binding MarR family transcriptional regulator
MSAPSGAGTRPAGTVSALHDPASPTGRLGLAFKRAMVAVRRLRGRETHRPGQPSHAQYSLLFALAETGERSARELAERADLTPGTVAQMLENLEAHGLVTRTRSAEDRRVVLSVLTELGAQTVEARRAKLEDRWQAAFAGFSEEELDAATRVIDRLAEYFDELCEEQPAA